MFVQICFVVIVGLNLGTKSIVHRPVVGSRCPMVVYLCSLLRMTDVVVVTGRTLPISAAKDCELPLSPLIWAAM